MNAAFVFCNGKLTVYLKGELDHHAAKEIRTRIDGEILRRKPEILGLDFQKVTFMDSSGLGLVMGRYKLMAESGGKIVIENPPSHIKKVMHIAGISKLATIVFTDKNKTDIKKSKKEEQENEACKGQDNKSDENTVSGVVAE